MPRELTAQMKRVLTASVLKEHYPSARATQKALVKRGLVGLDGQLTFVGWKQAVVLLPLERQCAELGIGYQRLADVHVSDEPEIDAWRYFSSLGWVGGSCEGGPILLLIRSAALDVLAQFNTFSSRQDACTRFTEAQFTILKDRASDILEAIRNSTQASVIAGFEEIYESSLVQEWYPRLSKEVMAPLFAAIGAKGLAAIAEALFDDPYSYRSGWPDLTLARGSEMKWLEVKTTDKLHLSQVNTIHRMKPLLPGSVGVIHLASND